MKTERIFEKYFNGQKNMVTPEILWYMCQDFGDETLYVELSEGEGFNGNPCFGATFLIMNREGFIQRIDLNKSTSSLEEILQYVDSINIGMISHAERYGEPKHLYTMNDI